MLVKNILVRPHGNNEVAISWSSESDNTRSFIFCNGKLVIGSFIAGTTKRNVILPVPINSSFKFEVHDSTDDTEIPNSIEELPQICPQISWNSVDDAVAYKIYYTIFDKTYSIESLLLKIPTRIKGRIEITCPIKLEGKNGRWYWFRIESVDQFGNESVNEIVPYFATDLPQSPDLVILRNANSGLLSFQIL
jgi:hypothetical protein